jgi:hypothetical protein
MFFWIGLVGIIASGLMVDLDGGYWALATIPGFTSSRTFLLLVALAGLVIFFDICAFGVIFAGGVIIVQRLRGRI